MRNTILSRIRRPSAMAAALVLAALHSIAAPAHGGRTDGNGGHYNRSTGQYHTHGGRSAAPHSNRSRSNNSAKSERPRHAANLDKRWMNSNGKIAPYTCRAVSSHRDVDIEHIVSFAEAKRSGLHHGRAGEFVNDMSNITVAYPEVNRVYKRDRDIGGWQPRRNKCWFARKYMAVKSKYGLSYDASERRKLDRILSNCSASDFNIRC